MHFFQYGRFLTPAYVHELAHFFINQAELKLSAFLRRETMLDDNEHSVSGCTSYLRMAIDQPEKC